MALTRRAVRLWKRDWKLRRAHPSRVLREWVSYDFLPNSAETLMGRYAANAAYPLGLNDWEDTGLSAGKFDDLSDLGGNHVFVSNQAAPIGPGFGYPGIKWAVTCPIGAVDIRQIDVRWQIWDGFGGLELYAYVYNHNTPAWEGPGDFGSAGVGYKTVTISHTANIAHYLDVNDRIWTLSVVADLANPMQGDYSHILLNP